MQFLSLLEMLMLVDGHLINAYQLNLVAAIPLNTLKLDLFFPHALSAFIFCYLIEHLGKWLNVWVMVKSLCSSSKIKYQWKYYQ